jgi:hypothetical protein
LARDRGKWMALIQVSIDTVVVTEILLGTIGAVAALVGAVLVLTAPPRAKRASGKAEQGTIAVVARRLSMIVAAQDRTSDPLTLRFTLADPFITLIRIEIANQLDKGAGTAKCVEEAPRIFAAKVEPKVVQRWYNANPYWDGETKQLPIRVSFVSNGQAASETIWVRMSPRKMPGSEHRDESDFAWFLEGPCSKALPTLARMPSRARTDRR